jgi:hypothetical protein
MYRVIQPSAKSPHGLCEYISLRCESKLEGFHDPLSNFANTAMRAPLADLLNLVGTSRYNVKIRHKIQLALELYQKPNVIEYWANSPDYFNHSELQYINDLADAAGYAEKPFKFVRPLPEDNGERFFMTYWIQQIQRNKEYPGCNLNDRCYCPDCGRNDVQLCHETLPSLQVQEKLKEITCDSIPVALTCLPCIPPQRDDTANTLMLEQGGKRKKNNSNMDNPTKRPRKRKSPVQQPPSIPQPLAIATWPWPTMPAWGAPPPTMPAWGAPSAMPPWVAPPAMQAWGASSSMPAWGDIPLTQRPVAQQQVCCDKFYKWASQQRRNGRPPHNKDCPNSSNYTYKDSSNSNIFTYTAEL